MRPLPYYGQIGQAFFTKLLRLLQAGQHIALFGARQGGKAMVLRELAYHAGQLPQADRPEIVWLSWQDYRWHGEEQLVRDLLRTFRVDIPDPVLPAGKPLSGALEEVFRRATRQRRPLWVFVQNVLGFPTPLARELLYSFQLCAEDAYLRSRMAVAVTGGANFIPLTYEQVSPYRHARGFLLDGLDREWARIFFWRRRMCLRGIGHIPEGLSGQTLAVDRLITPEAFDYLYEQTGGSPHLLQEVVLTSARHPRTLEPAILADCWERHHVGGLIAEYIDTYMPNDYFCRIPLREVERNGAAFDLLREVLEQGDYRVTIPGARPHQLEVCGLVRRDEERRGAIACPIWRSFLERLLAPRYLADAYARQHRWRETWEQYARLPPAQRDRPVSGEERNRLQSVLAHWEDSFVDRIPDGPEAVCEQFFRGAAHLLGFDAAGLYDRTSAPPRALSGANFGPSEGRLFLPGAADRPDHRDHEGRLYWLDGPRLRLLSNPQAALPSSPRVRPVLFLERHGDGRAIDTTDQTYLWHALGRFWHAYLTADQIQYSKGVGELREKHLKVIEQVNRLLVEEPFDAMGQVVQEAADALVRTAGYYRVLVSLVDARRRHIQGVASSCREPDRDFDFETNFPLLAESAPEQWDVQQWVVHRGELCVVADACCPRQQTPTTQHEHARRLGMQAITVVPMNLRNEVLGTIHFEREDRAVPPKWECDLFETLADQLAVALHQANRLNLLQRAVAGLTDQVRIIDPNGRVIFLNDAAASDGPSPPPGWQAAPTDYSRCLGSPAGAASGLRLLEEAERTSKPAHHYSIRREDGRTLASDELIAPIDDFRARLARPFHRADGRIGYVERVHDLTELYTLYEALQNWLAERGLRATAQKVLDFFRRQGYRWCRIYLIKETEEGDKFLESLEEFGLADARKQERFRQGGITFASNGDDPQPWHPLQHIKEPAIYEYRPEQARDRVEEAPRLQGLPRYWTRDVHRKELEKEDQRWIEAPLFVGERPVGLLSLSLPPTLMPEQWELLKSAVLGVAVAVHDATRAEEENRKVKAASEAAWKQAADEAVHQFTNKVVPVESLIHFALQDLSERPQAAREILEAALDHLKRARAILNDFRRYASDKPFTDRAAISVAGLLEVLACALKGGYTAFASIEVAQAPRGSVVVSVEAMREVLDILVSNTRMHSGLAEGQVRLEVSARVVRGRNGRPVSARQVRIAYQDNGKGVPASEKEAIFEPYRTTHPQGTGLGLAVARRNIQRQGGEMTEEGKPGKGACFAIYLPLAPRGGSR
jgi:signal transduction histidine kinase